MPPIRYSPDYSRIWLFIGLLDWAELEDGKPYGDSWRFLD